MGCPDQLCTDKATGFLIGATGRDPPDHGRPDCAQPGQGAGRGAHSGLLYKNRFMHVGGSRSLPVHAPGMYVSKVSGCLFLLCPWQQGFFGKYKPLYRARAILAARNA